jgi:hypothetical protein
MNELKSFDLFISNDKSKVTIIRLGNIKNPEGFQAHIGEPEEFEHAYFFSNCAAIIQKFLNENTLWHDAKWPDVGISEIDKKSKSRETIKFLKKFKALHVVTGGYNPPGITIIGENPLDEIRFTFQWDENSSSLMMKFQDALEKCHWWEKSSETH